MSLGADEQVDVRSLPTVRPGDLRKVHPEAACASRLPWNLTSSVQLSSFNWHGRSFATTPGRVYRPCSLVHTRDALVRTASDEWGNHYYLLTASTGVRLPVEGTGWVAHGATHDPKRPADLTIDRAGWFLEAWASNYFHWLATMLPKAALLKSMHPDASLLVPRNTPLTPTMTRSLELVGCSQDALLEVEAKAVCVKELIFVDADFCDGRLQREMRERILARVNPPPGRRRLYVTRSGAKWRRILNEDSVVRALESLGFEVVDGASLSFDSQVAAFYAASVVVGAHGAGLANIMFARPNAVVIELANPDHPSPDYYNLALNIGLTYCLQLGVPARKAAPAYDDLSIDVDALLDLASRFVAATSHADTTEEE